MAKAKEDRNLSRRQFLRTSVAGGLAMAASTRWSPLLTRPAAAKTEASGCRVTLAHGNDHADLAFRALRPFGDEVRQAVGQRRIVIKPNNVVIDNPLAATHAGTLEGILEFLRSIEKLGNAIIAESAGSGPTVEGFANYGYPRLAEKYAVKLVDLDQGPFEVVQVFDEKDFRPHAVRMSGILLDPDTFIISAARMKTHDCVVATLSLKNVVFGAPIKDPGFRWGPGTKPGTKTDKPIVHGSGFRAINYNLFALAQRLHPHLSVIDGFEGMQGNGPVRGTPVDQRVCLASPDWLAADRVALELMGIGLAKVGYLTYCAQAGLGQSDLQQIEITGERLADHARAYRLHDNIEQQLIWMRTPA